MRYRNLVKRCVRSLGFELRPQTSIPFGVDWCWDVRGIMGGKEPMCVFDVGANRGQTALRLSEEFSNCQIYSFEPVPSTFEMLCANICSHPNIEAINSAVGEESGVISITYEPGSGSNTTIPRTGTNLPTVTVPLTTIDEFCTATKIPLIDLLKIDVEGGEPNVLRGAQRMLEARNIRAILAECEFTRREDEPHGLFDEIWSFLRQYEFRVGAFYSGGVDRSGWVWGDCLFVQVGRGPSHVICSPWASTSDSHIR
ncbi:MAG: FkbM family methyltransferase [Candidatus Hydrogenedentes bacterium]|nr:FkbM family methyltransferase [Candidatus Hydrogenedentota bacterium]